MKNVLHEAVETIFGDLCRSEDGKFSNCDGGGTAVLDDPAADSAVREDS